MSAETKETAVTEPGDRMDPAENRGGSMIALTLGLFAAAWFNWAQEGPPAHWSIPLTVGLVASLVVAMLGGILGWRARKGPSAMRDPAAGRRFGIVVAIMSAFIGLGVIALGTTGHATYIAPWVSFVVGVHFWALAPVLQYRALVPLAVVVVLISVSAAIVGWSTATLPSAITGAGTGVALLVGAIHGFLRDRLWPDRL